MGSRYAPKWALWTPNWALWATNWALLAQKLALSKECFDSASLSTKLGTKIGTLGLKSGSEQLYRMPALLILLPMCTVKQLLVLRSRLPVLPVTVSRYFVQIPVFFSVLVVF